MLRSSLSTKLRNFRQVAAFKFCLNKIRSFSSCSYSKRLLPTSARGKSSEYDQLPDLSWFSDHILFLDNPSTIIDLLHSTNLIVFQLSCHTNIIYSEYPATVFSVIESQNKTVGSTTDSLFDLLMLKLSTR